MAVTSPSCLAPGATRCPGPSGPRGAAGPRHGLAHRAPERTVAPGLSWCPEPLQRIGSWTRPCVRTAAARGRAGIGTSWCPEPRMGDPHPTAQFGFPSPLLSCPGTPRGHPRHLHREQLWPHPALLAEGQNRAREPPQALWRGPVLPGPVTGLVLVQHRPWQPAPSLLRGILVSPTDARRGLGWVPVCPQHPSLEHLRRAAPFPHPYLHPIPVAPTLPVQARKGRNGSGQTSLHRHPAAPPAPAAGLPRDRVQPSSWPWHGPCRERVSGLGARPPTASWERAGEEAGQGKQRAHGRELGRARRRGEHWESGWPWSACPGRRRQPGSAGRGSPSPGAAAWVVGNGTRHAMPRRSQHGDASPGRRVGAGAARSQAVEARAEVGDGPGHAAWEPDGPWARLRRSLPPAPPGTVRRRGLRSAALAAGRSGDASMM